MTALIVAVFVASLVGSLHCAGMCGAFVAIASGGDTNHRWLLQAAYHGGRLVTYVAMGAAAGAAGQLLNLGSTLAGVQPVAAALAGAFMIAFGLVTLMRLWGWSIASLRPPQFMTRLLHLGHRKAMNYSPAARALLIGLLTTLLPCGWLYAFVATAAGTAHAATGMLTMAVFWVGTLPILVAIGAGVQRIFGAMGRHAGAVSAVLLMAVGLYTLVGRSMLDPVAMARQVHPAATKDGISHQNDVPPCCAKP
jgi:sulfite exporter TauE/SafE